MVIALGDVAIMTISVVTNAVNATRGLQVVLASLATKMKTVKYILIGPQCTIEPNIIMVSERNSIMIISFNKQLHSLSLVCTFRYIILSSFSYKESIAKRQTTFGSKTHKEHALIFLSRFIK